VKSVESTGRNGLLEQILRIPEQKSHMEKTHLKSVFRQAFIELTSSIASFLAEESSSSSGTIQEVSSRDAGGKPLTYTSDIKPEYVNAEKTVPSQGSRIPPEDIKELLKEFESLRKACKQQLQSNGTKFTGNQTVSNGEIEQKATVLARWFSSGSEISYSVRESSSGSENTVTKLTTLLNAIHTALDKRVLPEFTDPEYVKSATESPDVKGRADLWTKLFSISGVSESHSDITSSPPGSTPLLIWQTLSFRSLLPEEELNLQMIYTLFQSLLLLKNPVPTSHLRASLNRFRLKKHLPRRKAISLLRR
jgi:hypothetical protein